MLLTTNYNSATNKGYMTLLTVIIASAIATSITIFILTTGTNSSRSAFVIEQSTQAQALANACAEDALQEISDSTPFEGSGALSLGQGACSYTVTKLTGQNRTIDATGTIGSIVRKVQISIDNINPSINITSWQEVADF